MSVKFLPHLKFNFSLKTGLTRLCLVFTVAVLGIFFYTRAGAPTRVEAATAANLNFQARLLNNTGGIVTDGTYNVEFKLYNASSSSGSSQGSCTGDANCLWTETYISGNKLTTKAGYLSVYLGSLTSFPTTINWDQDLWLTIRVGGTGTPGWDAEMSPRLKLTAVPYAFKAGQLAKLTGANTSTLDFATQTGARSILLPDAGGTLAIATGGSFTSNGVLYGNGTTSIQATAAGTTGQCLVGNTSSAPGWASCSGLVTLQNAYAATSGNTIATTDARDIAFTLADTTTDSNFTINTATGSTGFTSITRADGAGTADPAQLLLVKNNDIDRPQPIGIKVDAANTNGKITTAFDASSANVTNALAIGGNAITGTNFSVTAAGLATSVGLNAGAGNITQTAGSTISAGTGFKINGGAATTGNYLRGDGTNFISSAIQAADVPVCSGTCNFISNQTGVQSSSNFHISGTGVVDTGVGIGTSTFGTNARLTVNANSTVDNNATVQINTNAIGNRGLVVQGFSGQTADLAQFQNSSGAVQALITHTGDIAANQVDVGRANTITTGLDLEVYGPNLPVGWTAVQVQTNDATGKGIIVKGAASQSADLLQLQDSSANPIGGFNSTGQLYLGRASNTVGQVNFFGSGSANSIALKGPTSPGSSLTLTLPSETGTICTNAATGACTATGGFVQLQSSTPGTQQTGNLNISGTGIFGTSLSSAGSVLNGTSLTFNTTGDVEAASTNSLSLGTSTNNKTVNIGAVGSTANTTATNIATSTGAAQTVKLGGTGGAAANSNSGTTVTLQGGATSETISNAGDIIQTFTNSATAFQVQNSTGAPIFLVDTTTNNLVVNPGFEVNTTGWAATGATASISQNTNKTLAYHGLASLDINLGASGTGAQITSSGLSGSALTPGTYTLSFYAKGTASLSGLAVAFTGGTITQACTLTSTTVSTGFQRFSCTFIFTTTNVTAVSITTSTVSQHMYLDAVQINSGSTLLPYQIGAIQLRGVITNPVTFMNNADSTTAFQIQNSAGTSNLFVADTLDGRIGIGTTAPTQLLHLQKAGADNYIKVDAGNTTGNYSGIMLTENNINWGWTLRNNTTTDNLEISFQDNTPTFTNVETFTRAGNVGINDTAPTNKRLSVINSGAVTATNYGISIQNTATNTTTDAIDKYGLQISSTGSYTGSSGTATNNYGLFVATPTGADNNYAAIFQDGNVGIGTTTPGSKLTIGGSSPSSVYGIDSNVTFAAGGINCVLGCYGAQIQATVDNPTGIAGTGGVDGLLLRVVTAATAFTAGNGTGLNVATPTIGAGSAITNVYGIVIQGQTTGTNNVGIAIDEATGTKNTNVLIGTQTIPTGSYSIYNSSADQNYFAGNLGIGVTVPNRTLDVGTSVSGAVAYPLVVRNSAANALNNGVSLIFANSTTPADNNANITSVVTNAGNKASDLYFTTYSGSALNDNLHIQGSTGNVGIGTATPGTGLDGGTGLDYKLHIVGSNSATNDSAIALEQSNAAAGSNPAFFGFRSRGTSGSKTVVASGDSLLQVTAEGYDGANYLQSSRIDFAVDGTPGTNDMPGRITFSTTLDGASSTTERLRIDNAGNVGIGTTNPGTILDVSTTTAANGIRSLNSAAVGATSGGGLLAVTSGTPSAADQRLGILGFGGVTTGTTYNYAAAIQGFSSQAWSAGISGSYLTFETNANGSNTRTERIRIDQNGNVGIGDTTPAALLTVGSGDKFQVDSSGNVTFNQSSTISAANFAGAANSLTIQSGSSTSGTNAGGDLNLQSGNSNGIAVGGKVNITAGSGVFGGDVVLNGGAGGSGSFNGNVSVATLQGAFTIGAGNPFVADGGGNINTVSNIDTGVTGQGQYGNLLVRSEDLGTTWVPTDITVTANDATNLAPDGQATAEKLDSGVGANHTLVQTYTTATNGNYTFSVWVKAATATSVNLRIDSTGATPTTGTALNFFATSTWHRFSITQNFTGTPSNIKPTLIMGTNSTTIYAWGAQLVAGTTPQSYVRTVASNISTSSYGFVDRGTALFQNAVDSTTTFQIQNAANTTTLFAADTTNNLLTVTDLRPVVINGTTASNVITNVSTTPSIGSNTRMALGLDGTPRIVSIDAAPNLAYIQCTNISCSTNVKTNLTGSGNTGEDIAIAPDGFARISFTDTAGSNQIKYIQCKSADCTSKVNTAVVSGTTFGQTGVALGSDGFARIVYNNVTTGTVNFVQCTNITCSTKTTTLIATLANSDERIVMGLDGFARIAYKDTAAGDVEFIQCTNADCSTNVQTTVEGTNNAGSGISLALGSDGFVRIVYNDATVGGLVMARCTIATCASGTVKTTIDTADATAGTNSSIAFGASGFPRIAYRVAGALNDLKYVQCANADCTTPTLTTVDSTNDTGDFPSIQVGRDDLSYIAYKYVTGNDLRLARPTASTGTTIGNETSRFGELHVGYAEITDRLVSSASTNIFQNTTNSTSSFQIQTSAGAVVLDADTTNTRIGIGTYTPGATLDVKGSTNDNTSTAFNIQNSDGTSLASVKNDGSTIFKNSTDSTTAFRIQNAAGLNTILTVDSIASNVNQTGNGPTFKGGNDVTGSPTGTGTIGGMNGVFVAGRYEYVTSSGDATACANGAGNGQGCELKIFDVSNPTTPVYVGGADASGTSSSTGTGTTSGNNFTSVYVAGHYAYIASSATAATTCSQAVGSAVGCELKIFDISNPTSPTYVGGADNSGSTNSGTDTNASFVSIYVSGHYTYVAATGDSTSCSQTPGSARGCEVKVFDVSNPAIPIYVGGMDGSGATSGGTSSINLGYIYVSGRYAYVGGTHGGTACSTTPGSADGCEFKILDITNPKPAYVAGMDSTGSVTGTGNITTAKSIVVSGRYAYVSFDGNSATACSQTAGSADGCELEVYDVSNPAVPAYVGGADSSGSTNAGSASNGINRIALAGRYLYTVSPGVAGTCSQTAGSAAACELKMWDVGTPATPTYVGGNSTSGASNSGSANVDVQNVFVSGHYVYTTTSGDATACAQTTAGSGARGCEVQVYDTSGIEAVSVLGHSIEAGTLSVASNANINNDLNIGGGLTVGQSAFIQDNLGVAGSITLGNAAAQSITVLSQSGDNAGTSLTVSAGNAGGQTTGAVGGTLFVAGGNAGGTGVNNGGNIELQGGAPTSTGSYGNIVLGPNDGTGTPVQTTLRGAIASGTNIAGADLNISGSAGTGTGAGGSLVFNTAPASTQTLVFDSNASANTGATTASTFSWSHTVGIGNNRLLIVGVAIRNGTSQTVSSVLLDPTSCSSGTGGTALTLVPSSAATNGTSARSELWYLLAPTVGSHTVCVRLSAAASAFGSSQSWFEVSQTTPFGTAVTNTASTIGSTITATSNAADQVVDVVAKVDSTEPTITKGGSQANALTSATSQATPANNIVGGVSSKAGATSASTWSWATTARAYAASAVALKATASTDSNTAIEHLRIDSTGASTFNAYNAGSASLNAGSSINFDLTHSSGTVTGGYWNITDLNTALGSTASYNNAGGIAAQIGQLDHNGTGTITAGFGLQGKVNAKTSGGVITTAAGVSGATSVVSGATITNSYSLWAQNPSGAGTVTNAYGLFIDDITKGSTSNYSIYAGAGTVRLAGDLLQAGDGANGLGDSSSMIPNSGFEINTDATTTVADGWISSQDTGTPSFAVTTTSPAQGTRSQQITATTAQAGSVLSPCFPITGGRAYSEFAIAKANTATTLGFTVHLLTYTTKANCTALTSGTGYDAASNVALSTTYTDKGGTVTPATTQLWARGLVKLVTPNVTATATFDSIRLVPNIEASGVDVAENYPVVPGSNLMPGTLVSFGEASDYNSAYAVPSKGPYDTKLFGVVSTQPGLTLSDGGSYETKPIALSGRVPLKVNGQNGPIEIGDPITASSTPGEGMKATNAGRIIGYALEAFNSQGNDQITVFINPGQWAPPAAETLQGQLDTMRSQVDTLMGQMNSGSFDGLNVSGTATLSTLKVTGDATIEGTLTVKNIVVTANITVNGHVLSSSSAGPTIVKANAAGQDADVSVDGTDTAGTITIKVKAHQPTSQETSQGMQPEVLTQGDLTTLTFHVPFELTPRVVITATNDQAVGLPVYVVKTNDGFKLVIKQAAQDGAEYHFDYVVVGAQTASAP